MLSPLTKSELLAPETPSINLDNFTPDDLRNLTHNELYALPQILRDYMISAANVTGGHFGANLGVMELTIALHRVFDTPTDKLVWDVGHQAYPHKIITERGAGMVTNRQKGGLSGFPKRKESPYDDFGVGHSSTSISAAVGMAKARDLKGECHHTIAVIGDGALSGGMAFEALNNTQDLKNFIVILNDNDCFIDPAIGAMSKHLPELRNRKNAENFFTAMGLDYVYVEGGNNLKDLMNALEGAKNKTTPILLHIKTQKGKGYAPAENAVDGMHAVKPGFIHPKTKPATPAKKTFSEIAGDMLCQFAGQDKFVTAITPAMISGSGLNKFFKQFPERALDVGIAEQHAVTVAAGMACDKDIKAFCAVYSTFLQRGYDQVIHDVALQNLPVRFLIDRAGLVGADGATHAGAFDTAFLTCIPNMVVMAPSTGAELMNMMTTAYHYDKGPIALRYPRGEIPDTETLPEIGKVLEIGKGYIAKQGTGTGKRIAILNFGTRLGECFKAAKILEQTYSKSMTIADMRFAKPLDEQLVRMLFKNNALIITIEEGSRGGFGSLVAEFATNNDLIAKGPKLRIMTLPDRFQDHATQEQQYAEAGLDATGIVQTVKRALSL